MLLKVVFLCAICVVFAQYPPLYPPYLAESCTNAGDQASHIAADEACNQVYKACMPYADNVKVFPPIDYISWTECQDLYVRKCQAGCISKYMDCLIKYPDLRNPMIIPSVLPDLYFDYCENRCNAGFIISMTTVPPSPSPSPSP
eukprot:TRINITY_DN1595_c0_g1_i2.p1 TRINITY_DN1595_c0_g1~~TRINITY_DN1595_c0_g1_i2.p1  ORF type:complete len:167 (-),score=7.75 TRINITY_DN1595_c0_g1_i2:378-809(-)